MYHPTIVSRLKTVTDCPCAFPFPLPLPRLPEAAPPLPFPCPLRHDRGPRSGYIWIPYGGSCILDATKRTQLPSCRILSKYSLEGSPRLNMIAIAPDLSLRTHSNCAVISISGTRCSRSCCGRAPLLLLDSVLAFCSSASGSIGCSRRLNVFCQGSCDFRFDIPTFDFLAFKFVPTCLTLSPCSTRSLLYPSCCSCTSSTRCSRSSTASSLALCSLSWLDTCTLRVVGEAVPGGIAERERKNCYEVPHLSLRLLRCVCGQCFPLLGILPISPSTRACAEWLFLSWPLLDAVEASVVQGFVPWVPLVVWSMLCNVGKCATASLFRLNGLLPHCHVLAQCVLWSVEKLVGFCCELCPLTLRPFRLFRRRKCYRSPPSSNGHQNCLALLFPRFFSIRKLYCLQPPKLYLNRQHIVGIHLIHQQSLSKKHAHLEVLLYDPTARVSPSNLPKSLVLPSKNTTEPFVAPRTHFSATSWQDVATSCKVDPGCADHIGLVSSWNLPNQHHPRTPQKLVCHSQCGQPLHLGRKRPRLQAPPVHSCSLLGPQRPATSWSLRRAQTQPAAAPQQLELVRQRGQQPRAKQAFLLALASPGPQLDDLQPEGLPTHSPPKLGKSQPLIRPQTTLLPPASLAGASRLSWAGPIPPRRHPCLG